MAKGNEGKGRMIAIIVAAVVVVVGVVVTILFATGVLGGPKMIGAYTLTGMKQGDEDLSSLLAFLNANGSETTIEFKDGGKCVMNTIGGEVNEEEASADVVEENTVEGGTVDEGSEAFIEEVDEEIDTTGSETIECTYDANKKTITVEGETQSFTYENDTVTLSSDGITMVYTRKK